MKTSPKFILLHPSATKSGGGVSGAWIALFTLILIFTFYYTLITTRHTDTTPRSVPKTDPDQQPDLVHEALIHYASLNTSASRMSLTEINSIAAVLRQCAAKCNLLVFGFTHETLLWRSLNRDGRTIFVDERAYMVSNYESKYPYIEAYDVRFTTKVSDLYDLLAHYREEIAGECRPVQNLLFSECKLAINDLPNHVYEVDWDIIIIDGPSGFNEASPGRMGAIFTAGVLARSKSAGTHVFVHEFEREVESVCSEEFLCKGNLVEVKGMLGHFVVKRKTEGNGGEFCNGSSSSDSWVPMST